MFKHIKFISDFTTKHITKVGILATMVGIISFLPVIMIVHYTKKTHNFPYNTLYLALVSNILWVVYGIFKDATATILMGLLYFTIYAYIFYTKFFHSNIQEVEDKLKIS